MARSGGLAFFRRHTVGLTFAFAIVLAVGLSLAPVPDWLKPFPELRARPRETAMLALLRKADRPPEADPGLPQQPPSGDDAVAEAEPEPIPAPSAPGAAEIRPAGSPGLFQARAIASLGVPAVTRARELEQLAAKVGARHVPIEDACTMAETRAPGCTPALEPLFRALEANRKGERKGPVRIVHLGDSLIASDHITDVVRERLQLRHGSGGKGFLFVDRPTPFAGRTVRTGKASPGWSLVKLTDRTKPSEVLGYSGVNFSTDGQPQSTEYDVSGATFAEVFFLTQPRGGTVEVRADGKLMGKLFTRYAKAEAAFAKFRFPLGTRKLSLLARGGEVQVYGTAVETGGQGVVYDSLGIPGATAKILLRADPDAFRKQLEHRSPSLVVVMLGGNEAYEFSRGWTTPEEARASFDQLMARVKRAAPGAACLLMTPLDAGTRTLSGKLALRGGTREMADVIRQAAQDSGCAYWDIWQAMGGKGALARWDRAKLMNEDLVHPRGIGGDVLGHLFDVALSSAFLEWLGPAGLYDPPGLEDPDERAFERVFSRLRELETRREGRVAIAQLGASHTASHYFTDRMRARLADRFGGAGRGYIAAGRPSPRLAAGGAGRELEGEWTIYDALAGPPSPHHHWGLTGIRAEGAAGALMRTLFCTDCQEKDRGGKAAFQVHYLEEPGMGRMEVLLDGKMVASVPDGVEPIGPQPRARVLTFDGDGYGRTVEIRNAGPGPVSVFGTSAERAQPGIVYDSLGLPGATGCTVAGHDPRTLATQLSARRPDLYVLFFGTNESISSRLDGERMGACYDELMGTLRRAAPMAECLILGPTDRMEKQSFGWIEAPATDQVLRILRATARRQNCAFWSPRAAMGGPGAIDRWLEHEPPLANEDHVHLSPEGYRLLADALADDLLRTYDATRAPASAPGPRVAGKEAP